MNYLPSQADAARELLARRAARRSLIAFTEYTFPSYAVAQHHSRIAEKLESVERGEIDRLAIFMPPRHGKSELVSRRFPAWLMGRDPKRQIIAASYSADLAQDFGRDVRNLVGSQEFGAIFPGVSLAADSAAAGRWNSSAGGSYVAVGVGGSITGRGAHVGIIDDPLKDRQEADSEVRRAHVKAWYQSTFYTRLMPPAAVVLCQCLPGDTSVTMADGTQKRLDLVRPGDAVLSWNGAEKVASSVSAVIDNGVDQTYLIRTKEASVRANARHPFLVLSDEGLRWVRTKDLRPGARILQHRTALTVGLLARLTAATAPRNAGECAALTTTKPCGRQVIDRHLRAAISACRTAVGGVTALIRRSLIACFPSKTAFAPSASQTAARGGQGIGLPIWSPTITTRQGRFAASYATTATGSRDELEIPPSWSAPSNTCGPDTDEVLLIEPYGQERVYDLSVSETHNFVANGLWTHNTRWHEDDLAGWLLDEAAKGGDRWEVLDLPALDEGGNALWPDRYPVESLERIRRNVGPREWSALYQQKPQPDEGTYFQRQWFAERWTKRPADLSIYGTSDYAVTDEGGDYTVHRVWGVDPDGVLYALDGWRGQTSSDAWVERKIDLIALWKPLAWFGEAGVIQKAVEPMLTRRMRERRVYCRLEWVPSIHDKPTRARGFQARAAMGMVRLPAGPVGDAILDEYLRFPAGKHDDEVDAASLIGRALDEAHPAIATERPKPKVRDRWADDDGDYGGWKTI